MSKPTRRSVLRAGVVLAATAAPIGVAEHAMSVVGGGRASGLRRTTFAPHVGTTFTFAGEGGLHQGVLKRIANLDNGPKSETRFRLVFKVKGSAPAQGTYQLQHGRLAAMALFVVPVSAKSGTYEAIVDSG